MKKITLVLLFCFCAVGFSQAQTISKSSSGATSQGLKSVSQSGDLLSLGIESNAFLASKKNASINSSRSLKSSSEPKDMLSLGLESNAVLAPKGAVHKKNVSAVARLLNDTFDNTLLSGVSTYENYTPSRGASNGTANNRQSLVVNHQGRMAITTYTDLATFEADAGMLTSEDFTGGPAGPVSDCGPLMSSAGGACFPSGELEEGFELISSNATNNVLLATGFLPNQTMELVGPLTFAESGTITFTGDPVFEVGMILFNNADVDTDLRIFDTGGVLLDTFTINNTVQTENFIGLISTDAIGFMEFEGANGSGELIGNFLFSAPGGGGGGGGMACSTDGLTNGFENGASFTQNLGRIIAHDIAVDADGDFMLENINLNAFIGATGSGVNASFVDIYVYEDAAGSPGALVTSELALVPTSQTVVGNNFGFDVWDVEIDVTDVMLAGQAGAETTYWVGVALEPTDGGNTFWENSTAGLVGLGQAYDDGSGVFVLDPTLEGVYSIAGTCTPMTGGMACSTDGLTNGFENGASFTQNLGRIIAHDIAVDADGDFMLENINLNAFIGATGSGVNASFVDIYVYEDAAGSPGALVTSELALVPTSQTVVGNNFGFDVWDVEIDVTDFMLAGQAGAETIYWVGVALEPTDGSNTFWENSTAGVLGSGQAYDDGSGVFVIDPALEGVYSIAGTCSPISGPPVLSLPLTFEAQTVPFVDFNGSATQAIPNPDASGINTSATVAENLVPGAAAFAGVNIVVPVDITSNKYFIMDVWSPLVDTPVLLKLEGGPNAPVERLVTMTTTGAWEQLLFDFSSEGALDYESVTVFMNFNVVDPANQTYYWDNLELLNAPPPPPAPSNDLCENAIPMSCGEIVSGTTINATEDSAVASECDTTVTAPGVWYEYEDASGVTADITITMCNGTTDYDSKLSVYSGDCGALVCVVGNDDTCGLQSEVSFQSDGATTFYILVHGFATSEGNFEIEMTCDLIPPPNDMIANSIDVDEIGFPYTDPAVPTIAATFEAGSPVGCDNSGARGVWYNFVSEGDGTATASMTTPGGGGLFFTVNNGPLAGSYDAIAAAFGGAFTTAVISEDTVVMIDDDASGDENDACDPLLNGASLAGKIAIARRGACAFTDKVIAAQNEGAIAVIVVNNQPGGPIVMGGDNPDITIPALMLGDADGEAVIAEVLGGGTLNVSMGLEAQGFNAVTFYTAPNENAVETDLELVDWFENQCLPGTSATIPTVAGQAYYVFVANHVGVTDIVIDGTNLGAEDITIEGFVYYPNPAGNTINLRAQENIERASIYNMLGQKVLDQNVNAISSELNLSNLATGTYILQVSVNGQIGNYQILKK